MEDLTAGVEFEIYHFGSSMIISSCSLIVSVFSFHNAYASAQDI